VSATPVLAAFVRHLDQATATQIAELEKKQDWAGMLALARAQLQREPTRADWWFLQGYALGRQGQHAAAVESYQQATRISPEDEGSWLALGQSQYALGQPELALRAYRQALRFRPESAQAYLALADTHQQQGRPDLALPEYRECVRYAPETAPCWLGLAAAYQQTGERERRDEALQALRKLDAAAADQLERAYSPK